MKAHLNNTVRGPSLQLHKVIRVGDKLDSQLYTFIVPAQLTRGFIQSVHSKEFTYAGINWTIGLEYYTDPLESRTRRDSFVVNYQKQPLGISLQVCGLSAGMRTQLEYIRFTYLHQEHYSRNFVREELKPTFTSVNNALKVPRWIESGFLAKEHYLFDDNSGLLELEIRGAVTTYEEQLRIPRDNKEAMRCRSLDSAGFTFGGVDWSVVLDWGTSAEQAATVDKELRPLFCIQRHSRSKHWTRLIYRVTLGWHESGVSTSGLMDQLVPAESGATSSPIPIGDRKWFHGTSGPSLTAKHRITISIDFTMVMQISRVDLIPTSPQGGKNCCRVSDPEGFEWIVMSDILGSMVKLRFFPDPDNVVPQRKEDNEGTTAIHSTALAVQLVPYDPTTKIIKSVSHFYVISVPLTAKSPVDSHLTVAEVSQSVILQLDVEKVCSAEFGYSRPSDNSITLRIEWLHICHLYRGETQIYDELLSMQHYQLYRDVQAQADEIKRLEVYKKETASNHQKTSIVTDDAKICNRNTRQLPSVESQHGQSSTAAPNSQSSKTACAQSLPDSTIHMRHSGSFSRRMERRQMNVHNASMRTPPVLINGSPQNGILKSTNTSPPNLPPWRRHSSCLEDVGTTTQGTRRRLPSPPPLSASMSRDGYLSVNVQAYHSYSSSPRLSTRNSAGTLNS
ncbi:unnamed protein product [Dicrocoelium dendriticum]|nr:unnamed protein product [Dicrocoelium dendriticum]